MAEVCPQRRQAKWRQQNAIRSTRGSPVIEFAVPVFVASKEWQSVAPALLKKHRSRRLHIMPRPQGYRSAYPRTNQELTSSRTNVRDLTKALSHVAWSFAPHWSFRANARDLAHGLSSVACSCARNETSTAARNHRARQNRSLRTQPASSPSLWTLPRNIVRAVPARSRYRSETP